MCDHRMSSLPYIPTLRLSITDTCFGKCSFCHREGQGGHCINNYMSLEMVRNEIIPAINRMGIPKVIITGGEPTVHPQLVEIARILRNACPQTHIGITTNGFDTSKLFELAKYVDKLTMSISSYDPNIYMRYTGIDPHMLLDTARKIDVKEKAISIVITEENYNELDSLLTDILMQGYEIKLQFVIGNDSLEEQEKHALISRLCERYGMYQIEVASTPTIVWRTDGTEKVRLKLASLNQFVYDNLAFRRNCLDCEHKKFCIERGCAVRIYPNGEVSPCLDKYISFNQKCVRQCIECAYAAMEIL